jgi:hypothetical protein
VLEQAMRTALTTAGGRLLQAVLAGGGDGYAGPHAKCPDGHQAGYAGARDKTITTVLGPVTLSRAWYHCTGARAMGLSDFRCEGFSGVVLCPFREPCKLTYSLMPYCVSLSAR